MSNQVTAVSAIRTSASHPNGAAVTPDGPYSVRSAHPGKPSGTYTMDWINMLPLPDAAVRVYHAVRMFIFEKTNDLTVSLTNEEIAELTPWPSLTKDGKPRIRDVKSVQRAVQALIDIGLFELVEMQKTSVTVPGKAKPEVRTVRTLAVADEPRGGFAAYLGPVNPFVARKAMADQRAAERAARRAEATARILAATDGTLMSGQNDQGKHDPPEPVDGVSAGQSDRTSLSQTGDTDVPDGDTSGSGQDRGVRCSNQPGESPPGTNTYSGGPTPQTPQDPAADAAGTNTASTSSPVVTDQDELIGDPHYARARKWAGPAACQAIDENPNLTVDELERVMLDENPNLTAGQTGSRAVKLRLFTDEARRKGQLGSSPPAPVHAS